MSRFASALHASVTILASVGLLIAAGCNCNGDGGDTGGESGTSDGSGTDGTGSSDGTSASSTSTATASASGGTTEATTAGTSASGTDSGGGENSGQISITIPLFGIENFDVVAGETRQDVLVLEVPTEFGTFEAAEFDLVATLPNVGVIRTDGGGEPTDPTIEFSIKLAAGDQADTVCDTGSTEGPVNIQGDADFQPASIEPSTMTTTQAGLDAVNSGMVSVCFETTATADAILSLSAVVATLATSIDCDPPADVVGEWTGTYSCVASGGPECGDEGGPISLTIFQGNHTAAYTDGDAFYLGTVCSDSFAYSGGGDGYDESGVFTRLTETTATKTSHYTSVLSSCEGDCTDDLVRQ